MRSWKKLVIGTSALLVFAPLALTACSDYERELETPTGEVEMEEERNLNGTFDTEIEQENNPGTLNDDIENN